MKQHKEKRQSTINKNTTRLHKRKQDKTKDNNLQDNIQCSWQKQYYAQYCILAAVSSVQKSLRYLKTDVDSNK